MRLSPRQHQMVRDVANDPSANYKMRGFRLGLSEGMVKHYMAALHRRLNVHSTAELAVWGVMNGYRDGCTCIVEGQRDRACADECDREPVGASH